jgi:phosphomannomutase
LAEHQTMVNVTKQSRVGRVRVTASTVCPVIDLHGVVKAYDIRGTVPEQLDQRICAALGAAFAAVTGAARVVVGRDMRDSGPALAAAFARGVGSRGADVLDIGLASTDMLYFASGWLDLPGAMFTASHNPARYNGIKLCRAGAAPIGQETGLADVQAYAQLLLDSGAVPSTAKRPEKISVLADYARYLRGLVDLRRIRPLRLVVDAGNGMAGYTVPAVLGDEVLEALPLTVDRMYFKLDGSFPNHEANPLEPANLLDLQERVVEVGADLGLAFDGDADRCFVVAEDGAPVSPSVVTALVAVRELERHPGASILHNLITSRVVPEVISAHGGRAVRTRVGHSFIKQEMARTGAVFGGEHSAHYYFRDFWRADTGMLAAMHVLAALGSQDAPLRELAAPFERYAASGEINSTVADPLRQTAAVRAAFAGRARAIDELDGLTVELADGSWLNVRASNTEPLLRLNVEGPERETMARLRDEALAVIRAEGRRT